MPTSRIKLKRTPAEEEEREWRKARRAARKAHEAAGPSRYRASVKYRFKRHDSLGHSPSRDGHQRSLYSPEPPLDDMPVDDAPLPPHKSMAELRAEIEEAHFRAKLFDASLGDDDDRLDALEASFNAYVPPRWSHYSTSTPGAGPSAPKTSDSLDDDPSQMNDDQYAEWIRKGMWARSHQAEEDARQRHAKELEAKKERARQARKEIEREERENERRREAKRAEREARNRQEAWSTYRALWTSLTDTAASLSVAAGSESTSSSRSLMRFDSLPWPIYPPPKDLESVTKEAVSSFLLSSSHSIDKSRKQRIREALLSYHPDRYIGRYLVAIEPSDHGLVQETVVRVTTILNALMEDNAASKHS